MKLLFKSISASSFLLVMIASAQITTNLTLTSDWRYSTSNLDGINWQAANYDDSSWPHGPGVLWVDTRGSVYPGIPLPTTEIPADPTTHYPFVTYYFRTHFAAFDASLGTPLVFQIFLDDGAVLYLNGKEIARPNMPPMPAAVSNQTLAVSYTCSNGNADCPTDIVVSGDLATNLIAGDNVLAVEVHNYAQSSPDITFGLSLATANQISPSLRLESNKTHDTLTLSWTAIGFVLQQTDSLEGSWTNVPGNISSGSYLLNPAQAAQFFRLSKPGSSGPAIVVPGRGESHRIVPCSSPFPDQNQTRRTTSK